MEFIRAEAKKSPVYLDQVMEGKGSIIINRSGVDFESSIMMGNFLHAIPSSYMTFRQHDFKLVGGEDIFLDKLNKYLSEKEWFFFFGVPDSFKLLDIIDLRPYVQLRALFGEVRVIFSSGHQNQAWIDGIIARLEVVSNDIAKMLDEFGSSILDHVTGLDFQTCKLEVHYVPDISRIGIVKSLMNEEVWKAYSQKNTAVFLSFKLS